MRVGVKILGLCIASLATLLPMTVHSAPVSPEEIAKATPTEWAPYAEAHNFHWPGPIFAMADIHGDARNALAMLYKRGLIDRKGHWTGGNAFLIQTGDIVDRGPDTRVLYAFFRRLREEARAAGGRVVNLWGNHEPMQFCGILNYVHPQDFEGYGSPASRFFSFSPLGEDGRDIRSWTAAVMVNRTLFTHAGVSPEFAPWGLAVLNHKVRTSIEDCSNPLVWEERSPMWTRTYSDGPESTACVDLAEVLDTLGADRMVVGHTIQMGGANTRCGGRLVLADVGMSRFINNYPALFEFVDVGENSTQKSAGSNDTALGHAPGDVVEWSADFSGFIDDQNAKKQDPMQILRLTKKLVEVSANSPPLRVWRDLARRKKQATPNATPTAQATNNETPIRN